MSLTSYQQAVLQEMGIPVWITKDAYAELKDQTKPKENGTSQNVHGTANSSASHATFNQHVQSNVPSSTPISQEEKQSRLAQLRANVGGSSKEKAKPRDVVTAKTPTHNAPLDERTQKYGANEASIAQSKMAASSPHATMPPNGNVVNSQEPVIKTSDAKKPASPEGIPLSAEQKAKSQQWLKDLQLACVQLGIPSQWANNIMIGHRFSVTESAIVLPATPLKLTTTQKWELWAQLISAARELNHSANGQ